MKNKTKAIVFVVIAIIYSTLMVAAHEGDHAAVCADCGGHATYDFLHGSHIAEVYCDDVNVSRTAEYNSRQKQLDVLSPIFIVGGVALMGAAAILTSKKEKANHK